MKRDNPLYLIARVALLIVPLIVTQAFELFVLPSDYFTFRVWEAALSPYERFPGGFYPNLSIIKEKEYGDKYRLSGEYKQYKKVHWYTDQFGWRNRPQVTNSVNYDIVTLGDSNIVGSYLDQDDTLAEQISKNSKLVA